MDEDEEMQQSSVENYTGVAIKVSIVITVYSDRLLRTILTGALRTGVIQLQGR